MTADIEVERCPLPNIMCGGVGVPADDVEHPPGFGYHGYRCRSCGLGFWVYRSRAS